jgi:hypothetical protein
MDMRSRWSNRHGQFSATMQRKSWCLIALINATMSVLAIALSSARCAAETSELKSQPPWAYTYSVDAAKNVEFLATTPSLEDNDVWLLLACSASQTFYISFMNKSNFGFPLSERTEIALKLDELRPALLPVAVIKQTQITANPDLTRDLFPLLTLSKILLVSIPERSGSTHKYSFSLQPNDLALRDINIHCFQSGA